MNLTKTKVSHPAVVRVIATVVFVLFALGITNKIQAAIINYALSSNGGVASSSSVGFGGVPSRAIDGNTDGDWAQNSVFHSASATEIDTWWEVDLGQDYDLGEIVIWNRTDDQASSGIIWGQRTGNFNLTVRNDANTEVFNHFQATAINFLPIDGDADTSFDVSGTTGRYIRIQYDGFGIKPPASASPATGFMHIAEMEVFGVPEPSSMILLSIALAMAGMFIYRKRRVG